MNEEQSCIPARISSAIRCVIVVLGALGACGCAAKQPQKVASRVCPSWTQGAHTATKFAPSLYIVGIGVATLNESRAQTERAAMIQAFGNIAAQIKVQVHAEINIHDWERSSSSQMDGGEGTSFQGSEVEQRASLQSEILLEGVDIIARCYEPAMKNFYVLAVLDRRRFAEHAQKKVRALHNKTRRIMSSLQKGESLDPMKRLRLLRRALQAAIHASVHADLARDVAGYESPAPAIAITQLKTEIGLIRSHQLTVRVEGDSPPPIIQAVQNAVGAAALPLAKETAATVPTAIVVEVHTTFDGRYEDYIQMDVSVATVSIAIRNTFRNQVEKTLTISEKRGGNSPQAAKRRVTKGIATAVEKQTARAFEEMLSFTK